MSKAAEIDIYHARMFGEFLAKMRGTRDADGSTLLDNSMLMYGAGLGDGNLHSLWNVSVAVLGGGRGAIKGGRHIIFEPGTPLSNLLLTLLHRAGYFHQHLDEDTARPIAQALARVHEAHRAAER